MPGGVHGFPVPPDDLARLFGVSSGDDDDGFIHFVLLDGLGLSLVVRQNPVRCSSRHRRVVLDADELAPVLQRCYSCTPAAHAVCYTLLMITKICEICLRPFDVRPYRAETARFCSKSCGGKWHLSVRKMVGPSLIGNQFGKGRRPANAFTSDQVTGPNSPSWVTPIELTCAKCGASFSRKPWVLAQNKSTSGHRFCTDACRREFMRGGNDPRYVGGPTTYRGRGWLVQRMKAVERDGGVCQSCGKSVGDSIPVHHVRPYRQFENAEAANQLSNLICYCQSCHMKHEGAQKGDSPQVLP